jgi:hypothetical protein
VSFIAGTRHDAVFAVGAQDGYVYYLNLAGGMAPPIPWKSLYKPEGVLAISAGLGYWQQDQVFVLQQNGSLSMFDTHLGKSFLVDSAPIYVDISATMNNGLYAVDRYGRIHKWMDMQGPAGPWTDQILDGLTRSDGTRRFFTHVAASDDSQGRDSVYAVDANATANAAQVIRYDFTGLAQNAKVVETAARIDLIASENDWFFDLSCPNPNSSAVFYTAFNSTVRGEFDQPAGSGPELVLPW